MQGADVTVSAGMACITVQYIQGHEAPPISFVKLRSTSTQPTVTGMIGTSGCHSVTDADAMDTIDSERAVTLDNILVPATKNNPSFNPSLLPTRGNQSPNRDIIKYVCIGILIMSCLYNTYYNRSTH